MAQYPRTINTFLNVTLATSTCTDYNSAQQIIKLFSRVCLIFAKMRTIRRTVMRDTSRRIQKTKDEIANALCSLLATEQYDVITIQEIADSCSVTRRTLYRHFKTKDEILHHCFQGCAKQFSDYISAHAPKDFHELCIVYFSFWNENMNMLTILNKSGIMYRFADEFESLVMMMSSQTGHISATNEAARLKFMKKYRFHFAYRTAGFWHVTEVWSRETPRKSPKKMADILTEITTSPGSFQIL